MSLVKWIRKNNRKIMVFVVIFSMVSFVVGYTGLEILSNVFNPNKRVVAHYGDGEKINSFDLGDALNELGLLKTMMADELLSGQGLGGPLLSHVLFPDSQVTGNIAAQLKQVIQAGQLPLSLEELEAFFSQPPQPSEAMWIILKAEAYRAGYIVGAEQARQYYQNFLVQMISDQAQDMDSTQATQFAGQVYSQTIAGIIANSNITEDGIFRTLGDLLSILFYANSVMDNQAVTLNEVKSFLGRTQETLNAELVRIDAEPFIEEDAEVSDEAIQKQFEAYKDTLPNNPAQDNPFGFGYKLPKRVQVEYAIVLMDDIKAQIEKPTADAMEEYYSSNIQRFQTQIPTDPNNPESEKISRPKSFAEVESQIRTAIENEKASRLANVIFNEIKDVTEKGFEQISFEEATADDLQQVAGEYSVAAEKITQTYTVPVRTNRTGWLSSLDLSQDEILSRLQFQQQQARISLPELLLSVSADPQQKTPRIGMPAIRMWQNIGPLSGYSLEEEKYHALMVMVRVVGIAPEATPENLDLAYDNEGVVLFDKPEQEAESVFSLKQTVKEDLLLQQAADTAKARAEELAQLAQEQGWDEAIAAYNKKYAADADPNSIPEDPMAVEMETIEQQTRASHAQIEQAKRYMREFPASVAYMQRTLITDMLNNRLFDLLEGDAETTGTIQEVILFEPQASCYVVKSVTRQFANTTEYLESKADAAMQLNMQNTAGLAMVHFSPANIIKRMNYQPKNDAQQATEEGQEE